MKFSSLNIYMAMASLMAGASPAVSMAKDITREEALEFLYSTMSLPDRADYTEEFYLENIDASLAARREMPWGETVPDREFLHFVLPVRVNNENLDYARLVFFDELKDRVKGLSMKDAILEVNHWCHELVTYKPSDGRTSSPLSSVSQAIGRCGEESTFAVAALRSVGIPARQIYTPRWAHTDDNHAWVEAWADGEWHFIGACEPEPVLDLAWFNAPASRGILMNTNVVGDYNGPEEVLAREPLRTRINVTSNYAPVATLPVEVVYADGTPAAGASVNFCIYNYAEFYPAVTKTADNNGNASLTSGLGDLIIWATDGKNFGIAKGSSRDFADSQASQKPVSIVLDKNGNYEGVFEFDIVPPKPGSKLPAVTPQQRDLNDLRMHQEDSIRNAYTATFFTPETAAGWGDKLGVDEASIVKILVDSRGNHKHLLSLLQRLQGDDRQRAIDLLLNVTEKDRRDIPLDVIIDNVRFSVNPESLCCGKEDACPGCKAKTKEIYDKYVLSPRIEAEGLRPWKEVLSKVFSEDEAATFRHNPTVLAEWVANNIALSTGENPQGLRMSPAAVLKEKRADRLSRNIFFVAMARSLGIPARIDPVTGDTQFMDDAKQWVSANIDNYDKNVEKEIPSGLSKGTLNLTFTPSGYIIDPKYYSQFSISRIVDGKPRQLEFDEEGTVASIFATPYALEPGQYILTSGQRMADGSVLSRSEIFNVPEGGKVDKELVIRQDNSAISVIGSLNAENIYHDLATDTDKNILSTTGRGYYVLGLISPNHEPSTHALNDISAVAKQLEDTGRKIVILLDDEAKASRFNAAAFPNLPSNVVFGIDNDGVSRNEIIESLHLTDVTDPVFVIADTFNRIVWVSTGYTIGIGESILSTLSRVE